MYLHIQFRAANSHKTWNPTEKVLVPLCAKQSLLSAILKLNFLANKYLII